MASEVYTTETVTVQDGTDVTLRPLNIKNLRRFMQEWKKLGEKPEPKKGEEEISDEDWMFEVIVNCSKICMEGQLTPDQCEETLDSPTMNRILKVCGGITFGNDDENLPTKTE